MPIYSPAVSTKNTFSYHFYSHFNYYRVCSYKRPLLYYSTESCLKYQSSSYILLYSRFHRICMGASIFGYSFCILSCCRRFKACFCFGFGGWRCRSCVLGYRRGQIFFTTLDFHPSNIIVNVCHLSCSLNSCHLFAGATCKYCLCL